MSQMPNTPESNFNPETDPATRDVATALEAMAAADISAAPAGLDDRVMNAVLPVLAGGPALRLVGGRAAQPQGSRWTVATLRLAAAVAIAGGLVALYMATQPHSPQGTVRMAQVPTVPDAESELALVEALFESDSSDLEQLIADADSLDQQIRSEWNPSELFEEGAM
jgi:hypothetical protein